MSVTGSGNSSVSGDIGDENMYDITPYEREELELLRTLFAGLSVE